eukprot:scaffold224982_cov24-Prasinocladus_malaysianus.AAC.1
MNFAHSASRYRNKNYSSIGLNFYLRLQRYKDYSADVSKIFNSSRKILLLPYLLPQYRLAKTSLEYDYEYEPSNFKQPAALRVAQTCGSYPHSYSGATIAAAHCESRMGPVAVVAIELH